MGATYIWSLKGGTIVSGDSTSVITVKWDSAGTWGMSVFEINQFGCVGDTIDTIVNVYMNPIVDEIMGDTIICGLDSLGKSYWVTGNAGATYEWIISGGTIVSGQSNDTIAVDWFPPGFGTLNVIEQSADSCFSDTFSIDIVLDNSNIIMEVVSDKYVDDEDIRIKWSLANGIHFNGTYYLSRKPKDPDSSWVLIATTTTTSFLDEDQLTSTKSYDYKVTGIDKCGDTIGTARHNSILLEGTMEEQLREVQLNWNHYINWPLGVDYYEIWRKLDDETDYTYYGSSGTDSLIMYTNGADGYDHCYRILAFEKGDTTTSWSNKLCLSFDHLLNIPNAFSPNGDGVNDTWVIENLDLYPENSLYIYNRWGNSIYHVANYKNTWRGMRESRDPLSHGLPDGNYYYIFSIITDDENIQTTYHGTVLIFR